MKSNLLNMWKSPLTISMLSSQESVNSQYFDLQVSELLQVIACWKRLEYYMLKSCARKRPSKCSKCLQIMFPTVQEITVTHPSGMELNSRNMTVCCKKAVQKEFHIMHCPVIHDGFALLSCEIVMNKILTTFFLALIILSWSYRIQGQIKFYLQFHAWSTGADDSWASSFSVRQACKLQLCSYFLPCASSLITDKFVNENVWMVLNSPSRR